ncbi:MAG: serine hydrolase [Flavobacteriales bacterium]|nr:serine hydrolase [Flavobacteriales bacterium]
MKKRLIITLIILTALAAVIHFTGNNYLYSAVYHNFANIDDYRFFPNRTIDAGQPQPWPVSTQYNTGAFTPSEQENIESLDPVAFLVFRNDSLLFERYWDGLDQNGISGSFSMAKSVVGALIGVAIGEGRIRNVDQPVGDFIPSFKEGDKGKITIRHLLTMSSGLDWDESYASPLSVTTRAYYGDNIPVLVDEMKAIEPPGVDYKYLSGNTLVLAEVIRQATGKKLSDYLSETLWKPMGAEHDGLWSTDREGGTEKAYCCITATARDFARIGKLYKDGGTWNGRQLIPAEYIAESIHPARLNDEGHPLERYGYAWWLLNHHGMKIFYARGILGQYVFVIPEHQVIIVRLGHHRNSEYVQGHPLDVIQNIETGLRLAGISGHEE